MNPLLRAGAAIIGLCLALPAAAADCDKACLLSLADRTVAAIVAKDIRKLPWAAKVRFTENGVPIQIGDGLWGSTGDAAPRKAIAVADAATGNVVWLGTVFDHSQPAFGALRLKTHDGRIAEVELVVARKQNPGPYGDAATYRIDPRYARPVAARDRATRQRLIDVADAYLSTKQQNDGTLFAQFTPDCAITVNGAAMTSGSDGPAAMAQGCEGQFRIGAYRPLERVRDRRFAVVDESLGIVVAISGQDMPVRETSFRTTDGKVHEISNPYPNTRMVVEVLRIEGGRIAGSEGVSVHQPYAMKTIWSD